jgi:hypothetical protein
LTCYAADFLLSARQEGFSVPEKRLAAALQRLNDYLRDPRYTRPRYTWHSGYSQVAVQSYAGFVLARDKKASLGSLRTLVAQNTDNARSGLALVHTGLALYLSGDTQNARKALSMAGTVNRKPNACYGDYGSTLRDAAMAAFLLEHYAPELGSASSWLAQVENELQDREWFSTQERNALVLVGLELERRPGREIRAQLGVNSTVRELTAQKSFRQRLGYDSVKDGLTVTAMGDAPLYATILLSGYGIQPLASVRQGIDIRRSYYDVNGNTIVPDTLRTGDLVVVRLDIANDIRVADALVVDLLPAGLELENQNLSTSFQMGRLVIDGKTIAEWKQKKNIDHEEYRDDRYVAALDLGNKGSRTTLFYLARAVTPGSYRVPNPHVEDMYRPNYHGVGETLDRMTITNK